MCGFTQDNILYVNDNGTAAEAERLGLRCAISFGPTLIVNGQPRIASGTGWGVNPRTCIGQRQDGAVLFLVIDGRRIDFTSLHNLKINHTLNQENFSQVDREGVAVTLKTHISYLGKQFDHSVTDSLYVAK